MIPAMKQVPLLAYVTRQLAKRHGEWPAIAEATGVPYSTICKVAQGVHADPRVSTVQRLADYFASTRGEK